MAREKSYDKEYLHEQFLKREKLKRDVLNSLRELKLDINTRSTVTTERDKSKELKTFPR